MRGDDVGVYVVLWLTVAILVLTTLGCFARTSGFRLAALAFFWAVGSMSVFLFTILYFLYPHSPADVVLIGIAGSSLVLFVAWAAVRLACARYCQGRSFLCCPSASRPGAPCTLWFALFAFFLLSRALVAADATGVPADDALLHYVVALAAFWSALAYMGCAFFLLRFYVHSVLGVAGMLALHLLLFACIGAALALLVPAGVSLANVWYHPSVAQSINVTVALVEYLLGAFEAAVLVYLALWALPRLCCRTLRRKLD